MPQSHDCGIFYPTIDELRLLDYNKAKYERGMLVMDIRTHKYALQLSRLIQAETVSCEPQTDITKFYNFLHPEMKSINRTYPTHNLKHQYDLTVI